MESFLITLKPLEPYFFGGEKNFDFGDRSRQIKQSYYIRSQTTPAQTTLLGALRYAVLVANNALIEDFTDSDQRKRAAELVGPKSFSFEFRRTYGKICKIWPLFIKDGEDYLIPMPMNHKDGFCAYTPMKVEEKEELCFSTGVQLIATDYQAKNGCGGGWLNLKTQTVTKEDKLFLGETRVGINAQRTDSVRDDSEKFFKKEYIRLCCGSFAFFAEMENMDDDAMEKLAKGVIVFLGQNRSAFILRAEAREKNKENAKVEENEINQQIVKALSSKSNQPFWYAPGDCLMIKRPASFYIAQTRLFRHLTTSADNRFYYRLRKTEKLYRLARAGAVFYDEKPTFGYNTNCEAIGMNHLIRNCEAIGMNHLIRIGGK